MIFLDLTFPRFCFSFWLFPLFAGMIACTVAHINYYVSEQKPNRRAENGSRTKTEQFPALCRLVLRDAANGPPSTSIVATARVKTRTKEI